MVKQTRKTSGWVRLVNPREGGKDFTPPSSSNLYRFIRGIWEHVTVKEDWKWFYFKAQLNPDIWEAKHRLADEEEEYTRDYVNEHGMPGSMPAPMTSVEQFVRDMDDRKLFAHIASLERREEVREFADDMDMDFEEAWKIVQFVRAMDHDSFKERMAKSIVRSEGRVKALDAKFQEKSLKKINKKRGDN